MPPSQLNIAFEHNCDWKIYFSTLNFEIHILKNVLTLYIYKLCGKHFKYDCSAESAHVFSGMSPLLFEIVEHELKKTCDNTRIH